MLIGTIVAEGGLNYNAMILADGGRIVGRTLKRELPNYGTFDEKRVFAPGPLPEPIEFRGVKLGVPICEDIWQEVVCGHLAEAGAEMLLVPNGSPYELDKDDIARAAGALARASRPGFRSPTSTASAARTSWRSTAPRSSCIRTASGSCRCPTGKRRCWSPTGRARPTAGAARRAASMSSIAFPADVYRAMMVALRDYVTRNGFPGVILGLSGGIDSALSAAVAVDALGPGQGVGRDAAVQIYQRGEPRGCARVRPAARLPS